MPTSRGALGWFAAALTLYFVSAAPGPLWADSSKLTLYALHGYLPSMSPGDHPGWTLVARAWLAVTPWWEAPRSLHLLSAVAGGAAVALLFLVIRNRAGDSVSAHTGAGILMVAHSHWWGAAVTESYALATALALLAALAAQRDTLRGTALLAGAAAGLAAATHAFSAFITVPLLLPHRRQRWPFIVAGLILGLAPMWLAIGGSPVDPLTGHHPSRPGSWLWHATVFLDPARALGGMTLVAALVAFGLGPLALAGVADRLRHRTNSSPHPRQAAAVGALLILLLVLIGYTPARLHLMVGFLAAGLLLAVPPRLSRRWLAAHVTAQISLYFLVPAVLSGLGKDDLGVRVLPGRNNAWYFLCPLKTMETGPEEYARALLAAVPPDALVLADFNPGALLALVHQLTATRPDVTILPTLIDELQTAPDPARAIAERVFALSDSGRSIVLAERWEPYYRAREMEQRFSMSTVTCGPGLIVRPSTNALP